MSYSNLAASATWHLDFIWTSMVIIDKFPAFCPPLLDAHLFIGTHGHLFDLSLIKKIID